MANRTHIKFLELNKEVIKEPTLIVGAKIYPYDEERIRPHLKKWGFDKIIGIDLQAGEEVDYIVDIADSESDFFKQHIEYFNTIICLGVLCYVKNPFMAAQNINRMLKNGGMVFLLEPFAHKISRMPTDLWRFTYEGTKELFSFLSFDDTKVRMSITRDKRNILLPLIHPLPQIMRWEKHCDETEIGFLLRRIHSKFFAKGIFRISRLLPEITIYSIARKGGY